MSEKKTNLKIKNVPISSPTIFEKSIQFYTQKLKALSCNTLSKKHVEDTLNHGLEIVSILMENPVKYKEFHPTFLLHTLKVYYIFEKMWQNSDFVSFITQYKDSFFQYNFFHLIVNEMVKDMETTLEKRGQKTTQAIQWFGLATKYLSKEQMKKLLMEKDVDLGTPGYYIFPYIQRTQDLTILDKICEILGESLFQLYESNFGRTYLHSCILHENQESCLILLLKKYQFPLTVKDQKEANPIHYAICNKKHTYLDILLKEGKYALHAIEQEKPFQAMTVALGLRDKESIELIINFVKNNKT